MREIYFWPKWNDGKLLKIPVRDSCKTCDGTGKQGSRGYGKYIGATTNCQSCIAAFKRKYLQEQQHDR